MLNYVEIVRYIGRVMGCETYKVIFSLKIGKIHTNITEGEIELLRSEGVEIRNLELVKE
jgi:hypothetical protein